MGVQRVSPDLGVSLVSTSTVWLGGNSERSALAGASGSFISSLNPFTAPPRSPPMLRSFFVPKTSATRTRTINQCQILSEPMKTLLDRTAMISAARIDFDHVVKSGYAWDAGTGMV